MNDIKFTDEHGLFKYSFEDGKIKKDSRISKQEHPVKQVEAVKKDIIAKKIAVDTGKDYRLKTSYKTGFLVAYNLHVGDIKSELDVNRTAILKSGSEACLDFKDMQKFGPGLNVGNGFWCRLSYHAYKLDELYKCRVNNRFFTGTHGDQFSESEQYVVDCLKKAGIVKEYRHGLANKDEADIVIESEKRQIEIVNAFENFIPNGMRFSESDEIRLAASIFEQALQEKNKIMDAVIAKFTSKKYTSEYALEIAMLLFGTDESAIAKLETLENELKARKLRDDVKSIHIVVQNELENKITVINHGTNKIFNADEISEKSVIEKAKIDYSEINDNELYIAKLKNLFDDEYQIVPYSGSKLIEYMKNSGVWVE